MYFLGYLPKIKNSPLAFVKYISYICIIINKSKIMEKLYVYIKTQDNPYGWIMKDDTAAINALRNLVEGSEFQLRWEKSTLDAYNYLRSLSDNHLSEGDIVIDADGDKWKVAAVSAPFASLINIRDEKEIVVSDDGRLGLFSHIEYKKINHE
jgi:hypothetical protein